MRITFTVTSAGDCWTIGGIPDIDLKKCFPDRNDGKGERFDDIAFVHAVRKFDNIQFSDGDRGCVGAFAALLLSSLGDWLADMDKNDGKSPDIARAAKRILRRNKGNKCGRVRIDLRPIRYQRAVGAQPSWTVVVRIRHEDFGVPSAERFDLDCAMIVADFCAGFSDKFVATGNPPLIFEPETAALLAALRERTKDDKSADGKIPLNVEILKSTPEN